MPGDAYDSHIASIARSRVLRTIDDVLAVMQELQRELADDDGVKWFNLLYLRVTESVRQQPGSGWLDQAWLERLDVVFAGLYFRALTAWADSRKSTLRSWRALFDGRRRNDVARIQFALAGMNAHINHDLAFALVQVSEERGVMPDRDSPQYSDFDRVNGLLERVEAEVKALLLSQIVSRVDQHLGRIDDVIALWKVRKARETAWSNGEVLWALRSLSVASRKFGENLDRLVSLAGKGLLVTTDLREKPRGTGAFPLPPRS